MIRPGRGCRRRALALVALIFVVTLSSTGAAGAQAGIDVQGPDGRPVEGPLLQLDGLLPGDSVTGMFEVVNGGTDAATLRFAGAASDSKPVHSGIASGLTVTVAVRHRDAYDEAWQGPVAALPEADIALGTVGAGQSIGVRLTGRLASTLTNAAAGADVRSGINLTLTEDGSGESVVLGVTGDRAAPAGARPPQTRRGSLPLTGLDAQRAGAALVGLLLVGLVLQRIARRRS